MNLSSALSLIAAVPGIFSVVSETVKTVESNLVTATGSTKLSAATAGVNAFLDTVGADLSKVQNAATAVVPLINAVVSAFNASGLFTHSASSNVAAPTAPVTAA